MIRVFPSELAGKVDSLLYRRLLEIYNLIYDLNDQISGVSVTTLTLAQLQQIQKALQAKGPAQLNVQGLLGVLAQSQVAGAPSFSSFPVPADPRSQDGALGVLAGTPNVLYRYDQVTRTWVVVGAMGLLKIDHGGVLVGTRPELNFVDDGVVWTIADDSVNNRINIQGAVAAYTTVEDEGTPLTQRRTINFVGAGVTATDSGGKTVVTIPSSFTAPTGTGFVHVTAGVLDAASVAETGSDNVVRATRPTVKNVAETTQTLSDGANIAWDMDSGGFATVTITANRQLSNPTNMRNGASYILIVKQDGSGGHTLTYDTAYKWPSGTAPTVAAGVNAISILTFISDGTSMFGVGQTAFA